MTISKRIVLLWARLAHINITKNIAYQKFYIYTNRNSQKKSVH